MKKFIYYLFIIVVLFTPIFVFGEEYKTSQLIPVDTNATVSTEKFTYQDFSYRSSLDGSGNTIISFNSIINNTISKTPVSVNILLFDNDQKNIGIVTYCSNKDYGSNYEGFKLNGNQAAPFSIKISNNKYFVKGKGPGDVKYISILDENKYCKIGGYNNYEGLTVDEITNGISTDSKSELKLSKYLEEFKESGVMGIILPIAIALIIFIVYGTIINSLYKKIYSKSSFLAYIPVGNIFVTFQVSFGKIVAFIGTLLFVASIGLFFIGIKFILYIIGVLVLIAFLIVLIKLFTKKYDLLLLEPSIQTNVSLENNNIEVNNTSIVDDSQKALDLSYDNVDDKDINDTDNLDISSGESSSNEELSDDIDNKDDDFYEEKDESDLTNFFR